jgi:hypothetical protein
MRVREYGRSAMTLGVVVVVLTAVSVGIAPLPSGVGLLRSDAHAEEATAGAASIGSAGGDATTGTQAAGRQGNVDGSRGSDISAGQSSGSGAKRDAGSAEGGGSEGDAASSAADVSDGDDRGGVSTAGTSAGKSEGGTTSRAGSVQADAPGQSPDASRGTATAGTEDLTSEGALRLETPRPAVPASTGAAAAEPVELPATGGGNTASIIPEQIPPEKTNPEHATRPGSHGSGSVTRAASPEAPAVPAAPAAGPPPLKVVSVIRDGAGLEVIYTTSVRERIDGDRYLMFDAAGAVVGDRPATPADMDRLLRNVRTSGLHPVKAVPLPAGSDVERVSVSPGGMFVRYRAGWTEDLAGGNYRFADPNGNTVVDRPATAVDRSRLLAIAGG